MLAQNQPAAAADTPQAQVLMALGGVTVIAKLCPQWKIDFASLRFAMDRAGISTADAHRSSLVQDSMAAMTDILTKEPTGETNPERAVSFCNVMCVGATKNSLCQYLQRN